MSLSSAADLTHGVEFGSGPEAGLALLGLVLVAVAASLTGRLGHERAVPKATLRALAQLAIVSVLLSFILRSWLSTLAFLMAMMLFAAWTSARRVGGPRGMFWRSVVCVGVPVVTALALLVGSGVVPLVPMTILLIGGTLLGGVITATTLTGRRMLTDLRAQLGEIEAALALGLKPRDAVRRIVASAGREALIPALDQTRAVGIVTLPGAYIGLLFGGATPVAAATVALLILVALIAVEALAAILAGELFWRACWDGARFAPPPPASRKRAP